MSVTDFTNTYNSETASFLNDVIDGLSQFRKQLPSKYFYDQRGSQLFDQICELDEYYPTRTEQDILRDNASEIVNCLGPQVKLIEYGSGSSLKTRLILSELPMGSTYIPVDVSREYLNDTTARLQEEFQDLVIVPVCADFTQPFDLPVEVPSQGEPAVFFPGSTIGNFTQNQATQILAQIADLVGPHGRLIIGFDLHKEVSVLESAYNDKSGVTAEFNKNILRHINYRLGTDFDESKFSHQAIYNRNAHRIEMYLVSTADQQLQVADCTVTLKKGEKICTEYSHKYTVDGFQCLAQEAGWSFESVWTDPNRYFAVAALSVN